MFSLRYKILMWLFAATLIFIGQRSASATLECSSELGMQDKRIPDNGITSSSELSPNHAPAFARLDGPRAWCSAPGDKSPYIQITLDEGNLITAITTQGSFRDFSWARNFEVTYMRDEKWTSYKKLLKGNRNSRSLKKNVFKPPIRTRSIRIYPKDPFGFLMDSTVPVVPCLRLELYGCSAPGIQSKNCTRTNTKKDFCVKSCDPSQDSPCKGNRLCLCDGDCGFSCVKTDRRCPTPEIPSNGRVRGTNTTFGSVIKYRCSSSYKLQGPKKRTCRGNGKWDGETPICKGRCTDPGDISNGRKQGNNYESGQKVKYTCSKGFTMQGSSTLTCKNTGSWNRPKPKCVCKRTNRKAFRYCKKSCNPKRRDCNKNSECVCDGDCGYSCVAKGLTCSRPVQIDNGNRQYTSTKFWSTVKYQCNKPYTLVGAQTRTCRGIRSWDGIKPVCKIICQDPGDITHGSKQSFRRNYDDVYATVGDRVEYNCYPGYKMEGSQLVCDKNGKCFKQLVCNKNGKWSGSKPNCTEGRCTDPGDISNGRKQGNNYESGQKVKYMCSKGFTMQGSSTLTCENTGSWNRPKPKCVCKRTNRKAFRYCKKSCDPKRRDCNKNNECVCDGDCGYSCVAKGLTCSRPVQIDNGNRQYTSTKFWSTVKYQCNKPYTLVGAQTRTCRGIRSWDGIEPVCKIICQDPGDITHGSKQTFRRNYDDVYATVGDRVEYNCYPGYKMEGSQLVCDKNGKCFKQLVCNKNGKWSGSKPNCTGVLRKQRQN